MLRPRRRRKNRNLERRWTRVRPQKHRQTLGFASRSRRWVIDTQILSPKDEGRFHLHVNIVRFRRRQRSGLG